MPCTARCADRAAGEAQGLHDERVGAEGQPLAGRQRRAWRRRPAGRGSPAAKASRNTASTSAADALPPAPWASVTTSSVSRGPTAAERLDAVEHGRPRGVAGRSGRSLDRRVEPAPPTRARSASAAWVSWMRWTLSERTTRQWSTSAERGHRRRRRSRRGRSVSRPRPRASAKAASRLRELPLVDRPMRDVAGGARGR